MHKYKKSIKLFYFILFIVFLLILLSSCSPYIPQVKDISKTDTEDAFLSNLEYHINSSFETWKISGILQDDENVIYSYNFFIYKITVDSNNFWIFDISLFNNKNNKNYFKEITSIDPFNILNIRKNFIQLGKAYLKWNNLVLEIGFKTDNFNLKLTSNLNKENGNNKNFTLLPDFTDFSNNNIYFISNSLETKGNLQIKDEKFRINSKVSGKAFIYRYFGKDFPMKMETFFIPLADKTYIIVNSPKNKKIDSYIIENNKFNKLEKTSYTFSEVLPDKNRRYALNWYMIFDNTTFNLIPLKKECVFETFFEDFWSNAVEIKSNSNDIVSYGIAIIDEFSRSF